MAGLVDLRRFESPDEVRTFEKGRVALVRVGGMTFGRAEYEPGWKWSAHVGPTVGASRCHVEPIGLVLSGTAAVATLFHVSADPHDSLLLMGANSYARTESGLGR